MYVCIYLFSDVPANPMSRRRLDRHSFLSIAPFHESKTCFFQILGTCFSLQPPMNCATSILRGRRRVARPSPKKSCSFSLARTGDSRVRFYVLCFLFRSFCFSASVSVIVQRPFCVASTRCSYLPKTPISFLLAGTGPFCRLPLTV